MSIRAIDWVFRYAPYRGSAFIVLIAFADWGDDEGRNIFPAIPSIAHKARISDRAAQYIVRRLERDGIIQRDISGGGRGQRAQWRLIMDSEAWPAALKKRVQLFAPYREPERVQALAPFDEPERVQVNARKGANSRMQRVQNAASSGRASNLMIRHDPLVNRQRAREQEKGDNGRQQNLIRLDDIVRSTAALKSRPASLAVEGDVEGLQAKAAESGLVLKVDEAGALELVHNPTDSFKEGGSDD